MNDPYDEIPLPSEGVLSDEESARQLREDSVRQYLLRIKRLEEELATVNNLVHAPGAWHCERCGFVLQKSVLHAVTGAVSANNEPFNEKCPNDGLLMKPLTWKKMSEDNYRAGCKALEREQICRNLLRLHGIKEPQ